MVTATFKRYVDEDRYTREFRPWTFIADLLTGVVQRDESCVSSRKLLGKWSEGLDKVEIRQVGKTVYMSDKTGKRIIPSTVSINEFPAYAEKIIQTLSPGNTLDESGQYVEMQRLEYKNGRVKITFNKAWE